MLLNFPRCLTILLLQTSKIDNNALDIDAIYNLKQHEKDKKSKKVQNNRNNTRFSFEKWNACFIKNPNGHTADLKTFWTTFPGTLKSQGDATCLVTYHFWKNWE
jgi:hypothetical protein